jgi:hypothetical protein
MAPLFSIVGQVEAVSCRRVQAGLSALHALGRDVIPHPVHI